MVQKTPTSDTKTKEEEIKPEKTCRGGANKAWAWFDCHQKTWHTNMLHLSVIKLSLGKFKYVAVKILSTGKIN